jgi:hypothetical protein
VAGLGQEARSAISIYVLIDGLGWELIQNRSFLDDVLVDRQPVETVLGYSSAAIPSLLSGRYPSEHGHWNLFYYSPGTSPFRWTRPLRLLPGSVRDSRVVRKVVKEASRRLSGYTGYFSSYGFELARLPFLDLCERRDIYEPGGLEGTSSLFDILAHAGVPYECYTYHQHSDADILALTRHRIDTSSARVFFLYLSGLDAFLHFDIDDAAAVDERLRWYEERLRTVYEAARARTADVRLFVFSDHGMTPVRDTWDMAREVRKLGLNVPDDFLPAYDSTMARFWIWSDRARERLTTLLSDHPRGRLLPEAELRDLGVWFDDGRYGHAIFLLHEGTILLPSDMGRVRFGGMHGYHPSEPTADAVFLSSTPTRDKIRHITGVLPVLLQDLGLPGQAGTR